MYVVIVGGGKVGAYLASVLLSSGNDVAIIEQDAKRANQLSERLEGPYLIICGDGCDSRYQRDAGVSKADVFVAVTGQDDANLVACEISMSISEVQRAIARVNDPKNSRIFHELGIETVSATALIANLIEEEALMGSMSIITTLTHGNVTLNEITIPRMHDRSGERGVKVSEVRLPKGALITAISNKNGITVAHRDMVLRPGDKVVVMANTDILDKVRAILRNL